MAALFLYYIIVLNKIREHGLLFWNVGKNKFVYLILFTYLCIEFKNNINYESNFN